MSAANNGGPAFPRPVAKNARDEYEYSQDGMSMRDWFAGQALAGIAGPVAGYEVAGAAIRAYQLADAMLAERAKGGAK